MKKYLWITAMLVAFFLLFSVGGAEEKARNYIESFGWEVDGRAFEVETITLPDPLDDVYRRYNFIQKKTGFNLEKFCGKKATRYTYKVLNHKFGKDVYANVLICDGEIIGADIMTRAIGGFMHGIDREEYRNET